MRVVCLAIAILVIATPASADDVIARIDRARDLYRRGVLVEAAGLLGAVAIDLQTRLGEDLARLMPEPPAGWRGGEVRMVAMGTFGGLTVTRGYQMENATLDAAVLVDSPAVAGVATLLGDPAVLATQPGMRRVRVGDRDALLRWEGSTRSGQIMLTLGDHAMLQAVGRGLADPELLAQFMGGWNIGAVAARLAPADGEFGQPGVPKTPPPPAR